jgi:hypothetical protein
MPKSRDARAIPQSGEDRELRLLAIQIVAQLPDDRARAIRVLDLARPILDFVDGGEGAALVRSVPALRAV